MVDRKQLTGGRVFVEKPKLFESIVSDIEPRGNSAKYTRNVSTVVRCSNEIIFYSFIIDRINQIPTLQAQSLRLNLKF